MQADADAQADAGPDPDPDHIPIVIAQAVPLIMKEVYACGKDASLGFSVPKVTQKSSYIIPQ